MKLNGEFEHYSKVRKKALKGEYSIVPEVQMEWLKRELNTECRKIIIFSHHSLENEFASRGIVNRRDLQDLLSNISDKKELVLSINGHDHADDFKCINGVYYLGLNGMSYIWLGDNVKRHDSLESFHKEYPILDQALLYKEGLFAEITIKSDGSFDIKGMETSFLNYAPKDIGVEGMWNGRTMTSCIMSRKGQNSK